MGIINSSDVVYGSTEPHNKIHSEDNNIFCLSHGFLHQRRVAHVIKFHLKSWLKLNDRKIPVVHCLISCLQLSVKRRDMFDIVKVNLNQSTTLIISRNAETK